MLDKNYVSNLYKSHFIKTIIQRFYSIFKRFIFLVLHSGKYDLFIIEKELFPNLPFLFEALLLRRKVYSLDFDDHIAANYNNSALKRFLFGKKIDRLVDGAKFVTVGNHWYFKEFKSKNLLYLPTVINLNDYLSIKSDYKSSAITIVWIGSFSTVKYLHIVSQVLKRLSEKYVLKLKVIGATYSMNGVDVECLNWSSQTEVSDLLIADIGIMPLENGLWDKGKCGFKLIQYMACGLPVVASSAPANEEIIDNGINGYIAYNEDDWFSMLETLILNQSLREQFGRCGRLKIENNYSYQVWGDKYIKYIQECIK